MAANTEQKRIEAGPEGNRVAAAAQATANGFHARRFLEIANRHSAMAPLLRDFVAALREITGCGAVGIRILSEDGRIPYESIEGFPREFFERENPLSIETDHCMCTNVITGAVDARLSFFTMGGSFYMPGTSRFLATISEEEKGQTRNICNEFGYETVVLVPIRLDDAVLGLIHLADPREHALPRETVEALEEAAMQLGTAIQRVRAEEALHEAHEQLESRVRQRTAELARANRALQAEIAQRRRLEQEVLRIGTREQQRIGQELHDEIGQELTGLGYLAKILQMKLQARGLPEAELAAEVARGIPHVLGQVQAVVKGVLPLEVGAEDLVPALKALLANVEERTGAFCRMEADQLARVSDDNTAIQLYRIAQEAVANAVRHGQARQIMVKLVSREERLILEIHDDGVGIGDDFEKNIGSGLRVMRYRAHGIGGTVQIGSTPAGGTRVSCTLLGGAE